MGLVVVALGGNALESVSNLDEVAEQLQRVSSKHRLIITHGNGIQVGELASVESKSMGILTAQTEAEIGLQVEDAVIKRMKKKTAEIKVEIVLTRVLVKKNDDAFKNPTKPIGRFYTKGELARIPKKGIHIKRLINGYRRVVASPKPIRIINIGSILHLIKNGYVVIAAGGGGIPVFYDKGRPKVAEAVLDKDLTSSLLASELGAEKFFILTGVDGVYLNFKEKGEKLITKIRQRQLRPLLDSGVFEEGSIKPKVEACLNFVKSTGKTAVIGNISKAKDVMNLKGCTVITP